MEDKKISKAELRRIEAEKKARNRRILFTVVCVFVCVGLIVLLAVLRNKNEKNKNTDNPDSGLGLDEVTDKSAAYSAGLTEDGKIQGIGDIGDYVVLKEDIELTAYLGDYEEVKNPMGVVTQDIESQIGSHMFELIEFYADVKVYSEYYDSMYKLYEYIYNDQYETYSKIYEENKVDGWDSLYDFLGVSETEYYKLLEENALNDTRHYMLVQALVEKYGITCTEQEKIEYCMYADNSISSEEDAKLLIEQYGNPYITQRTLEWKLWYTLADEAEKQEGTLTGGLVDLSDYYSSCYYTNGKIRGIGDVSMYITPADYASLSEGAADSGELLNRIEELSEFVYYSDYITNRQTELEFAGEGNSAENLKTLAEEDFRQDLTVQYLYGAFELDTADYSESYCLDSGLNPDEKEKLIFEKGEGYFNRQVMEYAVLEYLEDLIRQGSV